MRTDLENASKSVKAISNSNVNGFAKDTVALPRVCNDLRVSTADIENGWVLCASDEPAHLNVAHAVVDGDKGLFPELRDCPSHHSHHSEWRGHARPLCEAHAINFLWGDAGLVKGLPQDLKHLGTVVPGRLAWLEPFARRRDERVSLIRKHSPITHNPNPNLVCASLKPNGNHHLLSRVRVGGETKERGKEKTSGRKKKKKRQEEGRKKKKRQGWVSQDGKFPVWGRCDFS